MRAPDLPRPADGHTRFYRGEHPGLAGGGGSRWSLAERRAMHGRFFTDSYARARAYARGRGPVVYVDVPTADVPLYARDALQPVDGGIDVVLPRELADRRAAA